jgi:hypothetical protein
MESDPVTGGTKIKKEKIKRKEGEPPDLLRRRKDVYFPVLMITSGPTRIEAPERKFLQKLQLFLTPTLLLRRVHTAPRPGG